MSQQIQKTKQNKQPNNKSNKPTSNKQESITLSATRTKGYSGPIPHPDFMQKYAQIDPSFPDRIFKLTENNLEHQYKHQNKMDILQFLGWVSATIITLSAMGLGTYLLINDKDLAGFSFLIGSALPSIIIFFTNRSKQLKNDI